MADKTKDSTAASAFPAGEYEFRVVWKRQHRQRSYAFYQTKDAAIRKMIMLGREPWRAHGRDPDAPWHCGCRGDPDCPNAGHVCGIETVRKVMEERNEDRDRIDGPMTFLELQVRKVEPWAGYLNAGIPEEGRG